MQGCLPWGGTSRWASQPWAGLALGLFILIPYPGSAVCPSASSLTGPVSPDMLSLQGPDEVHQEVQHPEVPQDPGAPYPLVQPSAPQLPSQHRAACGDVGGMGGDTSGSSRTWQRQLWPPTLPPCPYLHAALALSLTPSPDLKRFSEARIRTSKLTTFVNFPLRDLDLREFAAQSCSECPNSGQGPGTHTCPSQGLQCHAPLHSPATKGKPVGSCGLPLPQTCLAFPGRALSQEPCVSVPCAILPTTLRHRAVNGTQASSCLQLPPQSPKSCYLCLASRTPGSPTGALWGTGMAPVVQSRGGTLSPAMANGYVCPRSPRPCCLQPVCRVEPLRDHHGGTLHSLLQEPRVRRVAHLQ